MAEATHEPVLVSEVVELLSGAETLIDLTVGAGGHARALLDAGVGRVVGIDRDPRVLDEARARLADVGARFRTFRVRFSQVLEVAQEAGVREAGGVLYDLGVSSLQLDRPQRGFSYRTEGPLDMRMGEETRTAADVVNAYPEDELGRLIRAYGEERFAGRIARAIVRARERAPLRTTRELAAVVAAAVPRRRGGPHPARRTFQAIRIEVNGELEELAASLPRAVQLLAPGGRLVAISYHSLEDRLVKSFLRDDDRLEVLTRKPVRPSAAEAARNPRARSAKLRAAERRAAQWP
ncbi:MAG TPA: 16S rRNA (cytosine(1402)-N(4))-methyltransferase RsmH [Actinomycetota bacterium]|nr:16S rRNA (cytosine(1402)-N(4))-methyltransferase RsmH [Actinomycetota bacterium]